MSLALLLIASLLAGLAAGSKMPALGRLSGRMITPIAMLLLVVLGSSLGEARIGAEELMLPLVLAVSSMLASLAGGILVWRVACRRYC